MGVKEFKEKPKRLRAYEFPKIDKNLLVNKNPKKKGGAKDARNVKPDIQL